MSAGQDTEALAGSAVLRRGCFGAVWLFGFSGGAA